MDNKLTDFYLVTNHEEAEFPDWVPIKVFQQCSQTQGHALCAFIVDFTQHLYFPLSSHHHTFSPSLKFYKERIPLYDSISDIERRHIKEHARLIRSFISDNIPVLDRLDIVIFEDFHMRWMGEDMNVTQKFVPLDIDRQGNVKTGIFTIFPSACSSLGKLIVLRSDWMWTFDHNTCSFIRNPRICISKSGKKMMMLSRTGVPLKTIAEQFGISINTLKKLRDRLFRKLRVNCLQGAITAMDNYGLW